ncbi:MAG: single-stranded DNA-binding protein [Treponema sp.]|nr:single-stranded DNA-binding protein [Treponema sp.]
MGDLAVAVIVGRLTRDAELKYTNSGQAVCHFSVATNSRTKKAEQWVDESNYWDIDLWGKRGETINQYLTKGKLVAVHGDMRQDRWEQDGQTRMKVRINANDVQFLGSGQGGNPGAEGGVGDQGGYRDSRGENRGDSRGALSQQRSPTQNRSGAVESGEQSQTPPDGFTDDIPF